MLDEREQEGHRARRRASTPRSTRRWSTNADVVPYGHRKLPFFMSDRMDFESALFHPVLQADYTTFALKG